MGETEENNNQNDSKNCVSNPINSDKIKSATDRPAIASSSDANKTQIVKRKTLTTKDINLTDQVSSRSKPVQSDRSISGKQHLAAQLCEQNPFTFKPKCAAKSLRIAESLSSNFSSRQEEHIQAKQRYVS